MHHYCYIYIYYRFIVRFPIGLDILFITLTFLLHLLLSWTSSLSIPIRLYLLLHSLTMSFLVFQPVFCLQLYTPYHLSLPLLMKVVIGSTPTSLLNSSFVLLSFNEIPHIHIIICISALSNFNPTSTSNIKLYI